MKHIAPELLSKLALMTDEQRAVLASRNDARGHRAGPTCRSLGYLQTAYTSSSALWGLYCLPEARGRSQVTRGGVFIKTAEFGLVFLQTFEDLHASEK